MADEAADAMDLGPLSPAQREALEQYTDVTGQQPKDAVPLLDRSQWNVQIAVTKFFDGEVDVVAEDAAAQSTMAPAASTHATLQDSWEWPRAQPNMTEAAPRVVPQPATTVQAPRPLRILYLPVALGARLFSGALSTVIYMLSLVPLPFFAFGTHRLAGAATRGWRNTTGRRALLPRDNAARFKRELEEEYGTHALPLFEGGHAQAVDAAKRDLNFLLIVLMSPEHDDTEAFTRDTLLSEAVVAFINANNMLVWGGNVLDSEAYQVAAEYQATNFPFSALVSLTPREGSSTRMSIVKRLTGPMTAQQYLAQLQAAVAKYAPDLAGARAERVAQQSARQLREAQDKAYQESLTRDRERRRQRREREETERRAEQAKAAEAERVARTKELREQWRSWRLARGLAPEPDGSQKDAVRLALNLPPSWVAAHKGRIVRRFAAGTTTEELYAFVECYDMIANERRSLLDRDVPEPEGYTHKFAFTISSMMPRETFAPSKTVTLGETLGRGGNLVVEEVADEYGEERAD